MKPVVGLTIGDYNGIGPEILLKCATHPKIRSICTPVLVGPYVAFEFYAKRFRKERELRRMPIIEVAGGGPARPWPGRITARAGMCAGLAIEAAVDRCTKGEIDAIVTAPVSKEALSIGGYGYPGQTELLQKLTGSRSVAMMFLSERMKVGLATIHVPLIEVPTVISRKLILEKLEVVASSLKIDFCLRHPRIAVLGLNPHAGENGLIGVEEKTILMPALRSALSKGLRVSGPFSADSFFAMHWNGYDAVLAMYHDQGLIPVKLLSRGKAVNFTAGLNIVRTSPDHGTAFNIAGKGTASPSSMVEAIRWAVKIFRNRARGGVKGKHRRNKPGRAT
ncbi:MAG TPA: 4-hydroxythreonine-4-phosphate dehydrogenase PdxA [Bacteroidota bacterium]